MVSIPQNIQELNSYKPGKPIADLIKELNLDQWAILWNNENNLGPSPIALEHIAQALATSNVYPDPSSFALRELIANANDCHPNQVMVNNGSETILDGMFRAFFETDEELLTCEGTFVAVYVWAKSNKIKVNKAPLSKSYRFDIQHLVENITPKTKAIYIANPNNPTGTIITKSELDELLEAVPENILVVIDEAYFEYAKALSPDYPDSTTLKRPNVLTLRTFSKAYGIAAIRIGYAIGPEYLIDALNKVRMTFAPSNAAQAAGIGAIKDTAHLQKSIELNTRALPQFYAALHDAELNYIPSYGNFVMLDMHSIEQAKEFTEKLMKKGVFIRHLPAFGLPHCVRISTGTEVENELFVKTLASLHD
jgi:histidinol-phosphate aminotransferase